VGGQTTRSRRTSGKRPVVRASAASDGMAGDSARVAALPSNIGVVGVGTIASAMVRGLCSLDGPLPLPKFILSPRGTAKSAALAAKFPDSVRVAKSNQEVVDAAECIIIAVLPKQAEEVLSSLTFRQGQQVLSLIATVNLGRLQELVAPAAECAIGVPLPAVAKRQGASLLLPARPFAQNIFDILGSCVAVNEEAQFRRLQCVTALMGDFYKRQQTTQEWLVSHRVPQAEAAAWVGACMATMAVDSSRPGPGTFADLVAEQTPGGLNEMVWKGQEADGNYEAVKHSLDSVHHRLMTGTLNPDLPPAAKRAKVQKA